MVKAIYAGSLDPIHYGHIDIIERASKVFDELVVAIGANPDKKYTFSLEERLNMARYSLSAQKNVRVKLFDGLLVDYAYEQGIPVIVKGVRSAEDFGYEQILHHIGDSQKLGIESFVLFSKPELSHISSGAVKALQKEQGFVHEYVPLNVKQKLEGKMSGQYIFGITGEIGAGKSYVGRKFSEYGKQRRIGVHNIELDEIGHQILGESVEELYVRTRRQIAEEFGETVELPNGMIDRKILGEIVFNDSFKMNRLNQLLYPPLLVKLRRAIYGKRGLIFLNAALLAEAELTYLCNNNVVLVSANESIQNKRLQERGLSEEQIKRRKESQYDAAEKARTVEERIGQGNYGRLWRLDNCGEEADIGRLFDEILKYFNFEVKNE